MPRPLALLALLTLASCTEYDLTGWEEVEVFNQNPADEVDILLVVDNSCSMGPYQLRLSTNFSQFIAYFIEANVDYHIGVVTTDLQSPAAGHLVREVITPDTADAAEAFVSAVTLGTGGSGFEMGLEAARLALAEPLVSTVNTGFLRDQASLSLIFVSDEEDSSPLPVNDYINTFRDVKGQRSRDVFNASALAVTDEAECTASQAEASSPGTRYVDVAHQTAGIVGNLCSTDFDQIITDLSLNASRLRDTFFLAGPPNAASLQVSVQGEVVGCDAGVWRYDRVDDGGALRPAIIFDRLSLPQPSEQIAVRYDPGDGDPALFCTDVGQEP